MNGLGVGGGGGGVVGIPKTPRTINQHSPGGVAERGKKDGISIPIKTRVTSLPTPSPERNSTPPSVSVVVWV